MKKILIGLLAAAVLTAGCSNSKKRGETSVSEENTTSTVYDFKMQDMQGKEVSLADYDGKVLLVVNTASKCGYTSQFAGLEELYKKYENDGLVVLGFPSNEFGGQDPGSNEEILQFCRANYGVTFPMFAKIRVNGEDANPLYKYLKANVPNTDNENIKWNFTKFLIGKDGKPMKRYESTIKPEELEIDIRSALKADI